MGASPSLPCIPWRRRESPIEPTARRLGPDGLLSSSGSHYRSDVSEDEDDERTSQRLMAWAPPLDSEAKLRGTSSLVRWPTEDRSSFSESFAVPTVAVASRVTPPRRSGSHERPPWSSSSNTPRRSTRDCSNLDQSPSGWTVTVPEEESDDVGYADSDSPTSRDAADEMEIVEAVAEPVAVLLTRPRVDDDRASMSELQQSRSQTASQPPTSMTPPFDQTPKLEDTSPTTVAAPHCTEPAIDQQPSTRGAGPELASALGSRLNRLRRGGSTISASADPAPQTLLGDSKVESSTAREESIRDCTDTGDSSTSATTAPTSAASNANTEDGSDPYVTQGPTADSSSSGVVECSALEQHLDTTNSAQPHRLSEKVARLFGAQKHDIARRDGSKPEPELQVGASTECADEEEGQSLHSPSRALSTTTDSRKAVISPPGVSVGSSSEALKARWRSVFARFDDANNGVVSIVDLEKGVADSPALARELGLPSNVSTEGATSLR